MNWLHYVVIYLVILLFINNFNKQTKTLLKFYTLKGFFSLNRLKSAINLKFKPFIESFLAL